MRVHGIHTRDAARVEVERLVELVGTTDVVEHLYHGRDAAGVEGEGVVEGGGLAQHAIGRVDGGRV